MPVYTNEEVAKMFGVSVERIREQHRENAKDIKQMYDKAVKTGRKVNGYTAAQLDEMYKITIERGK